MTSLDGKDQTRREEKNMNYVRIILCNLSILLYSPKYNLKTKHYYPLLLFIFFSVSKKKQDLRIGWQCTTRKLKQKLGNVWSHLWIEQRRGKKWNKSKKQQQNNYKFCLHALVWKEADTCYRESIKKLQNCPLCVKLSVFFICQVKNEAIPK